MKLHGRITLFGEYLIKENLSYCLSIKSKSYLSTDHDSSEHEHPTYNYNLDSTIKVLYKYGYKIKPKRIYGTLPLSYGLSSSTVLSILHLNDFNKKIVQQVDKTLNGVSPSNLDFTSIMKQGNGFFGFDNWQPIIHEFTLYSLFTIPKEANKNHINIKKIMSGNTVDKQIKLTKLLYSSLNKKNKFETNIFYDYCRLLLSIDVYNIIAKEIISHLLLKSIPVKCIGGLYDKAILVIYENKTDKIKYDKYILDTYPFACQIE